MVVIASYHGTAAAAGLRSAAVQGASHNVTVHELGDNHGRAVTCSCGWRAFAYFGEPHAEALVERHFEDVGVTRKVVLL